MRKSVWIFLLAVLLPSALLGWLALRSAEEQKIILERRTAELYQRETESLAAAARAVIDEQRREFADAVRTLLARTKPDDLSRNFAAQLGEAWPRKAVGFTIDRGGMLCSPAPRAAAAKPEWQKFLWEHGAFLGGDIAATVYNVPVEALTQPDAMRKKGYETQQRSVANKAVATPTFAITKTGTVPSGSEKEVLNMKLRLPQKQESAAPMPAEKAKEVSPTEEKDRVAADAAARPKPRAAQPAKPMPQAEASRDYAQKISPSPPSAPVRVQQQVATAPIAPIAPIAPTAPTAPAAPAPTAPDAPDPAPEPAPSQQLQLQQQQQVELLPVDQSRGADFNANTRQVQPQQLWNAQTVALSALAPETAEFRTLTEGQNEGILTRFVQDKLSLVFWLRPPQAPELIFGCMLDAADLRDLWPAIMPEQNGAPEFVLALLDDKARPLATSPASENGRDWKRPLVASEIGEALPHWEAALYLMRPEQLAESALGLRRTLILFIVGLLGAIALGGWLVVADARRQFALAQQKTDFVSNVSHELKTPLTSIRMFAELMHSGRTDDAKAPQYLRIIMVEAERLTRLINNVLDFAKLERRQKRFDKKSLDLHAVIGRTWEGHELHLRDSGFVTKWQAAPPPYPVVGDDDALAQILVNLLSNAEKYSGERKEIELHTYFDDDHICVSVLDRGLGVPSNEERKIFEAFYRAHDSLSSGIQGSGLGLTLAQRLAREHDGEITYRAREGGGSDFTLRLPLAKASPA